jgi:hypothetical protein
MTKQIKVNSLIDSKSELFELDRRQQQNIFGGGVFDNAQAVCNTTGNGLDDNEAACAIIGVGWDVLEFNPRPPVDNFIIRKDGAIQEYIK